MNICIKICISHRKWKSFIIVTEISRHRGLETWQNEKRLKITWSKEMKLSKYKRVESWCRYWWRKKLCTVTGNFTAGLCLPAVPKEQYFKQLLFSLLSIFNVFFSSSILKTFIKRSKTMLLLYHFPPSLIFITQHGLI